MKKMCEIAGLILALICVAGCATKGIKCVDSGGPLKAEHVATLDGFKYPECALYHPDSGRIFVSNIECAPEEYWVDDSMGFVSVVEKDNTVKALRWLDSRPSSPINGPKGMIILGKHLYIADNTRLLRCTLDGKNLETVASGFQKANDLCTDGSSVWLSDVGASRIYCIGPDGKKREIKAPQNVNGITFSGKSMFGVSWDLHEVYELDPTGKKEPVAFGLAEYFTTLDGIEVLKCGTFIVSDFKGNQICTINPDRKTVKTLIKLETPADIGLDRKAGILYVPQLFADKLSVFKYSHVK